MSDQAAPHPSQPPSLRRRKGFIVAALLMGCLPFLLLEAGLRIADIAADVTYQDPLVGFSRVSPLFEQGAEAGIYRTARSRHVLFGVQEFAIQKPENGFRVFCLGGSTVRGRPYTTETAFPRWMQLELAGRDSGHQYEVVNCGGLSYASYRLTHILQEVLAYDPDLIVIATGHNEFLEDRTYGDIKSRSAPRAWIEDRLHRLRVVRVVREWARGEATDGDAVESEQTELPELVEARLDQASGYASYHRDDAWAEDVLAHFDQSLRTMIGMCRQADVPAVLVLLGSNVRDCPPIKSEHRPGLTVDEERAWQADVEAALAIENEGPQAALAHYQSAIDVDDEHALLRFRVARLLDRLGRLDEAAMHYVAAKDIDVCPLRMREPFADALRSVAQETETPLIDARALVDSECDGGLPGNDWYLDHVHPSIAAHQRIAAALVSWLEAIHSPTFLTDWGEDQRRELYERHLTSLGPHYLTEGYERVSWLENWARRHRLLDETLPRDPAASVRYGHRLWDFGKQEEAWSFYRSAMDSAPEDATVLLWRCEQLFDQGRRAEAVLLLDRLDDGERLFPADELARLRAQLSATISP